MGLLKSKYEKDLDAVIKRIDVNCSNNYKDAAQQNLQEFEQKLLTYVENGYLKGKKQEYYAELLKQYKQKMTGFTHKDQKPYWT